MHPKIALVASNAPAGQEAEAELRPLYDFVDLAEADLLIALGGDGFLLHMLHQLLDQRRSLPVFGMNRGTVGFLMNEFRVGGLLDRIANARPFLIHPLAGDITTLSGERHILPAINEISLLRETRQAAKLEVVQRQRLRQVQPQHLRASRTLKRMLVDSGTSAPRQRRGRKGLIGVSASIAESSGRIGPFALRL